ncbi:hypothetical protein MMYC01_210440 [Madurella mycetomatis]|uniref:Uncharacterized protein n=1 Tax=Madurella mycetomatis TaxID=100816 RepID=A0A175VPA7_9PEZI|nr:hypothetical protein MMYC01_210440 [Madurella mycetomatis]
MSTKSLAVFGHGRAGKKSIVGSLIYRCGLDLQKLGQLEIGTNRKISEIVPFFDQKGIAKAFYAPSAQFVVEDTATPDVAFWVVDASSPDQGAQLGPASLARHLAEGSVNPKEKLIILVNKIVRIVPIAALQGGNLIESPDGVSWTGGTLMEALG